eukprot:scaffold262851_cov30-Tisochrysis_lutea.AAC.1
MSTASMASRMRCSRRHSGCSSTCAAAAPPSRLHTKIWPSSDAEITVVSSLVSAIRTIGAPWADIDSIGTITPLSLVDAWYSGHA